MTKKELVRMVRKLDEKKQAISREERELNRLVVEFGYTNGLRGYTKDMLRREADGWV